MDRREDDLAAQAWPGFVDILSSTVIMFVFFVMVVVVVLFLYTIKFTATVEKQAEQRIQESVEQASNREGLPELEQEKAQIAQEIKELKEQKKEIAEEIESMQTGVKQLSSGLSNAGEQDIIINDDTLIVLFEDNSIKLTEDSLEKAKNFLLQFDNYDSILIEAGDNPLEPTQSSSRRLNLARMLNLRNVALSLEIDPSIIKMNYIGSEKIEGRYNWVKLKVK